ncbi:micrococcal nuclease [Microbacteriaceae bacterium SG_E_30_P1]|uniref:Micrococcal nuclease n=1 Tax=Antiquaquibacter oligotrophicus TaxID=2880260 RepID=A0ABT6KK07_9MICO|nr:thermonuclease family protein [Antiquaquibacter oligotrophicus]MDH6180306.1 micrococcal nuclease [Antiquaquibacter oligotrophicus]UDF13947.1 thermonuclease family protein [Antiquaquibacter oligotrophicus]
MRRAILVILLVFAVFIGWALSTGWSPVDQLSAMLEPQRAEAPTSAPADPVESDTATQGIPADATQATVEYVHDGDTLFLTDGRKVRLLGINTPEIGDNAECWGDHATSEARELLPEGSAVWVQQDIEPLDQYGRSLLFVFTEDGTNVNVELVRRGAAQIEQYEPNWLHSDELHAAEEAASAELVGLWGSC